MAAQGSAYQTNDFDLAYARTRSNIMCLVAALGPLHPKLRVEGTPEGIPFLFDERTVSNGLNFTLMTDAGDVDLLGQVDGFLNYEELKTYSTQIDVYGVDAAFLSIPGLIRAKRAANRPKDLLALPELEALNEAETHPEQ